MAQPVIEVAHAEHGLGLAGDYVLILVVLLLGELRAFEELAEASKELRLECADREPAPVGGLVGPVAGETARQHARHRLAAEAVRNEIVGAMRDRDDDAWPETGSCPLDERCQHLCGRAEGARCEVRDLDRWQSR